MNKINELVSQLKKGNIVPLSDNTFTSVKIKLDFEETTLDFVQGNDLNGQKCLVYLTPIEILNLKHILDKISDVDIISFIDDGE